MGLVEVDVAGDLRSAGAEAPGVRRELGDLASLRIERVPVRGKHRSELRVAHDRGVPDPVDRLDAVDDTDRVQPSPRSGGEDAGVDLQVQVAVRVTGPGGVVPNHGGLEFLDRDLDLPPAGPDPGGGVLGEPADDLTGCLVLGLVVGSRDLRVDGRDQRPRLRAVDHDLHEPQTLGVLAQSALRLPGLDVVPRDPPLVGRPVQHARSPYHPLLAVPPGAYPLRRGVAT